MAEELLRPKDPHQNVEECVNEILVEWQVDGCGMCEIVLSPPRCMCDLRLNNYILLRRHKGMAETRDVTLGLPVVQTKTTQFFDDGRVKNINEIAQ